MHAAADVCNRSVTTEFRTEKVPQIRDQFPMRGKTAFDPVESDVFWIQMMLPTEVIIKFLKRFLQFRRGIRKGNPMFKQRVLIDQTDMGQGRIIFQGQSGIRIPGGKELPGEFLDVVADRAVKKIQDFHFSRSPEIL